MDEPERLRRLAALDRKHLWHPFTPADEWEREDPPLIVERGEGAYLIDVEGRRYLDGVSSLWVNLHGHRREELDRAVRDQLGRIAHSTQLGMGHPAPIELAARLAGIAPPGLTRVFYSDSGATAVEIALKMAFQYQRQRTPPRPGKGRFMALGLAYHGDTLGAVSAGGIDLFHHIFGPLLFPVLRIEAPYCCRCPRGAAEPPCPVCAGEEAEAAILAHAEELAAVILEPMAQGAAGMIVQPPGFLRRIREACTRADVLLIADEVATGFGRTGRMFACEHAGVSPDILCLAKGITGGYLPLAATLATEAIYDAFRGAPEEGRTFFHGHSYTGNPLGCAAALANLDIFEKDRTLDALQPKIARLWRELESLRDLPHVGEVRGLGFMAGIELVRDKAAKAPFGPALRMGRRVILAARKRGLAIRPLGDVVVLMPPYCVSEDEIAWMVRVVRESIEEAVG
ncbi:MAG: adenosylmethionine--8-amino-7-oxononanoate transaminase [Candidatus Tectomicrobia bacterium]|uniref:Adenosylmethionine-8-amino-7-oxononanoate aminotransferase n=1 Tax=Tectimicrobiota bacterium TaxID=2528274 RepID=A0A932HVS9_UNCTE|nr:adenosylmethionine--8-amino-7-oxononanoate transaminase [Candidatus Tectomicrobia bacterium]